MELHPPDPHLVQAVNNILSDINYVLPFEVVQAVIAAHNAYLTTGPGRDHLAHMLGLDFQNGRTDVDYFVDGDHIPSHAVSVVHSYIVNGTPVIPERVEAYKVKPEMCDLCQGMTVCNEETKIPGGYSGIICAHCAEQVRAETLRHKTTCKECTFNACINRKR